MDRRIAEEIPNLTTLMLANNNVRELADLEGLTRCPKLTHLVLAENPVTKKEVCDHQYRMLSTKEEGMLTRSQHYRLYMIWSIPSLRFLDYQRVRDLERKEGKELFGTLTEPSELALKIRGVKSKTFDTSAATNGRVPTNSGGKAFRAVLTDTEKKRVQQMLQNAKSMAEIDRIEKDLAEGRVPKGAADVDRMAS